MLLEDPIAHFQELFGQAARGESFDPARAALATASEEGEPGVRFVLVKHLEQGRFVVYTHLESPKGRALTANARAALAFHWASTGVQVRVSGPVSRVADDTADAYFASRPRGSQLGAWASQQSMPLADRDQLQQQVAAQVERFGDGPIPRPAFWSGFEIEPSRIEFWHNQQDRLHDRFLHERVAGGWRCSRLSP